MRKFAQLSSWTVAPLTSWARPEWPYDATSPSGAIRADRSLAGFSGAEANAQGFCSVRKSIRPRVQNSLRGLACLFPCPSAIQPSRRCDSDPLVPPVACGGLGCRTENVVVVQSRMTAKNLLKGVPLGDGLENSACLIARSFCCHINLS